MCEHCEKQGTSNSASTSPQARIWDGGGRFPCPFPLSPGDLHGAALRRLLAEKPAAETDRMASLRRGIEHLERLGLLRSWEGDILRGIAEDVVRSDDLAATHRRTLAAHRQLLDGTPRGELAITLSSIAVNSIEEVMQSGSPGANLRSIAGADLEGALEGAGTGAELGGTTGAVVGAVVGAAIKSFAAWLHHRSESRQ